MKKWQLVLYNITSNVPGIFKTNNLPGRWKKGPHILPWVNFSNAMTSLTDSKIWSAWEAQPWPAWPRWKNLHTDLWLSVNDRPIWVTIRGLGLLTRRRTNPIPNECNESNPQIWRGRAAATWEGMSGGCNPGGTEQLWRVGREHARRRFGDGEPMRSGEFTRGHLQWWIREKRARAADFPSCGWRGGGGRKNREKRDRARVCLYILMMRLTSGPVCHSSHKMGGSKGAFGRASAPAPWPAGAEYVPNGLPKRIPRRSTWKSCWLEPFDREGVENRSSPRSACSSASHFPSSALGGPRAAGGRSGGAEKRGSLGRPAGQKKKRVYVEEAADAVEAGGRSVTAWREEAAGASTPDLLRLLPPVLVTPSTAA
jgi:hypothetical protein